MLLQGDDDPHKLWRSDCSVRGGLHHSFVALWGVGGGLLRSNALLPLLLLQALLPSLPQLPVHYEQMHRLVWQQTAWLLVIHDRT